MARLNTEINLNSLPQDEYALLKEGLYDAIITEASIESNSKGTGQLIKLKLSIIAPTNKGAVLFHRINYIHQNPDAQRIGQVELRQIMEAIGLSLLSDTDELLNKPLQIKVGIQPPQNGYEASNEIKKFSKSSANASAQMSRPSVAPKEQAQPQPQAEAPIQKPSKRPW